MKNMTPTQPAGGASTCDPDETKTVPNRPLHSGHVPPDWLEPWRVPPPARPPMKPTRPIHGDREFPAPEIPDQELMRRIGRGSFGEVWLSRGVTGVYRAVKVVRRQRFRHEGPYNREFHGIQNYEKISLTHPGLMAVLHVGRNQAAGYFYYVMEIADDVVYGQDINPESYVAKTLRQEVTRRGRLPVPECVEIGLVLAASLAHLQQHGLIHRDVKPSNVIYIHGAPKFADIGLVSRIEDETSGGACTLLYAPPEGPGGPTTDIYGLGRVLYELSTGWKQEHFPEPPDDLLDGADGRSWMALNRIILRACAKEPHDRFPNAQEMHAALLSLHRGLRSPQGLRVPSEETREQTPKPFARTLQVYVSHLPGTEADAALMQALQDHLPGQGFEIYQDDESGKGLEWVHKIENQIKDSDVVVALLSDASIESEMLAYDIELAHEAAREQQGRPRIVPIRVNLTNPLPATLAPWIDPLRNLSWQKPGDTESLLADLVHLLRSDIAPETRLIPRPLEAVGGAVPLASEYYIERATDLDFKQAISRGDSIVLVKGARQIGKTSLLARGLQHAREAGRRVVLTDFQKLDATHLASADALYLRLGDFLADQLDLKVWPEDTWDKRRGANINFERYLRREVLGRIPGHLVWGLDEVDRLFACEFGGEVFALLRSWHNERALDPDGPWSRLTLAIAYATEAHLFITDVNQSPFNVGTRLALEDFTPEQVDDLNRRHEAPLRNRSELMEFVNLLGGQPYLVRQALHHLASGKSNFSAFVAQADRDEGVFGDHLRRILVLLAKDPNLCDIVRGILRGETCRDATSFYRLRSAGLIKGDAPEEAAPRCGIYASYMKRHLL